MLIIEHRINWSVKLQNIPENHGVEIDLRSLNGDIILAHDPFVEGERFVDWLKFYRNQFLVLNIKEEGIEDNIIEILRSREIENYFFLDQSFPFLIKLIRNGNSKTAVRVSDFESVNTALATRPEWCWLDSFGLSWDFLLESVPLLDSAGIKTCLVSPELHGRSDTDEIIRLKELINTFRFKFDAVCTKNVQLWKNE